MRVFKRSVVSTLLVNFIKLIKEMKQAINVACIRDKRYAHVVLVRKAEKKKRLYDLN